MPQQRDEFTSRGGGFLKSGAGLNILCRQGDLPRLARLPPALRLFRQLRLGVRNDPAIRHHASAEEGFALRF